VAEFVQTKHNILTIFFFTFSVSKCFRTPVMAVNPTSYCLCRVAEVAKRRWS